MDSSKLKDLSYDLNENKKEDCQEDFPCIESPDKEILNQICIFLIQNPNNKASYIAKQLELDKTNVNSILYKLKDAGYCELDDSYRWKFIIQDSVIQKYKELFKNLEVISNGKGMKAPHKHIMLISILRMIGRGDLKSNQIFLKEELKTEFRYNWVNNISYEVSFNQNYIAPFLYMKSEPFWNLFDKNGEKLPKDSKIELGKDGYSLNNIYAKIDNDLFFYANDEETRELFISFLIEDIKEGFIIS